MNKSETIGKLAGALAKVQANLKPAKFNAQNPHLKNKYADLNSIMDACRDLLAENGLSFVQLPTAPPIEYGPAVGLRTVLMHESGEWLEDAFYLPIHDQRGVSTPQVAGSVLTYARRYALAAMLGIVTDEDTDGHQDKNGQGQQKKQAPKKRPAPSSNNSTPALKPEPVTNGVDWRAKLTEGRQKLSNVMSAAANGLPTVNSEDHAMAILKKHFDVPEEWTANGFEWKATQPVKQETAVVMYNFIAKHEGEKADKEAS